jgi:SAM-dependent methyltransferase
VSGQCPLCGASDLELVFRYDSPPAGETPFPLPPERYGREFRRCTVCGHFVGMLGELELEELYSGAYVDATYSAKGLASTYDKIMSLPPERSDNAQRVRRVAEWAGGRPAKLLDVGSGLGVFPARMKEEGWDCVALDPDARAVEHIRSRAGVEAVEGDFMTAEGLGSFDAVSFNKVLEHVPDPVGMLGRARAFLEPAGVVYVEVPDGEMAATDPDGPGREEFFIEHLHIFSFVSIAMLADRAGYRPVLVERLREPSTKLTLRAFLVDAASAGGSR